MRKDARNLRTALLSLYEMELRPSQILLRCYDCWLQEAKPSPHAATVVLHALRRALVETRAADEELESVGAMLRRRAPARGQTPLKLTPLSTEELLF